MQKGQVVEEASVNAKKRRSLKKEKPEEASMKKRRSEKNRMVRKSRSWSLRQISITSLSPSSGLLLCHWLGSSFGGTGWWCNDTYSDGATRKATSHQPPAIQGEDGIGRRLGGWNWILSLKVGFGVSCVLCVLWRGLTSVTAFALPLPLLCFSLCWCDCLALACADTPTFFLVFFLFKPFLPIPLFLSVSRACYVSSAITANAGNTTLRRAPDPAFWKQATSAELKNLGLLCCCFTVWVNSGIRRLRTATTTRSATQSSRFRFRYFRANKHRG